MTLEALAHQLVMYLITLLGYNIINENYVNGQYIFLYKVYPPTVSMIWLYLDLSVYHVMNGRLSIYRR